MATEKKVTLEVATTPIAKAMQVLEAKRAEIQHITDSVYKTKGTVPTFSTKIQDETKIEELIKMASVVLCKEDYYNRAQAAIPALNGQSAKVFTLDGSRKEDLLHDINLRILIIQNKERIDEVNSIKKDLEGLMDKEDKMALVLKRIEGLG